MQQAPQITLFFTHPVVIIIILIITFSSNESDNDKEIVNQTIMIKWNKNKKPL